MSDISNLSDARANSKAKEELRKMTPEEKPRDPEGASSTEEALPKDAKIVTLTGHTFITHKGDIHVTIHSGESPVVHSTGHMRQRKSGGA